MSKFHTNPNPNPNRNPSNIFITRLISPTNNTTTCNMSMQFREKETPGVAETIAQPQVFECTF